MSNCDCPSRGESPHSMDCFSERGHVEMIPWDEVLVGHILRRNDGELWTVTDQKNGWALLARNGETIGIPQFQRGTQLVASYVPSEGEALDLLHRDLGARILKQIEETQRTLSKAAEFRVDPIARKATALRDHIDWLHGVNVDDVLRRHNGTPTSPASKETKKASVQELCDAHDEMHERPDLWPHSLPHHHAKETP